MISCEETRRLLSDSQDRRLSSWEWISLRVHLLACGVCPLFGKQLRLIRAAFARMKRAEDFPLPEEHLSEEASARIQKDLTAARQKHE